MVINKIIRIMIKITPIRIILILMIDNIKISIRNTQIHLMYTLLLTQRKNGMIILIKILLIEKINLKPLITILIHNLSINIKHKIIIMIIIMIMIIMNWMHKIDKRII